jgi:NTE family protein
VHRPGAIIGGAEMLTGARHAATLTGLRDCALRVLTREVLEPILHAQPAILAELARLGVTRMREPTAAPSRKASILGFVAVCDSVAMRELVEALADRMRGLGAAVTVLGADGGEPTADALSALESVNDYVLFAAERRDVGFTAWCGRQIDRLILAGNAHSPLPDGPPTFAAAAIRRHRLLDFILIQPPGIERPSNSTRWLDAAPIARLIQLRAGDAADLLRLARIFTGRSVGLVLSGGGARAYAHIGALKALGEIGIPADFLAGVSMGGVIAAGVGMGWSHEELDRRIRDAFVDSSPLSDIAFPLVAMTHGRVVDKRLETHFGDTQISDLWRPFTCISTDLTTGDAFVHRSGRLRDALRASISLPGLLPPVVINDHVHVDGALVANLPVDLVRQQHDGFTIAVDVAEISGLRPEELKLKPPGLRWLTTGAFLKGPPIVSVLIRSATLPAVRSAHLHLSDPLEVLISPELDTVQLQDWKAYDTAVAAGYRATLAQAEQLTTALL